ncbi:MAG: glutamine synthetase III [Kiritimatiellae bacterium]|nr:glutamine synthetase III [Kiritimatiellia bacterium]
MDTNSYDDLKNIVPELYGADVFSDAVMRERLPKSVYRKLRATIEDGTAMDASIADVIATAMKDWALEKGATHFSHWFQPMTGSTAEKHDAFIAPRNDGTTIMEFSGKELIKGEPDASSFPSGGLRATFEARGYTAWDCTSPVFVKKDGENTALFIPCAFCSYTGEALDAKTPLLRSMEVLNRQAVRVLRALGNTTSKRVTATLGAEQEYFLVDRRFVERRLDLMLTGRSLFGAPSPKGQEMEDQYFGTLHDRIGSFMADLNKQLWKLGVSAKTQHNEVAPGQYEIAPIFGTVNVATDWNQLTMETLEDVALRHGFVCLLHEKPFAGVNGSGKHNNWSMATDDGLNLLEPGLMPHENMVFLVCLCAVIQAVSRYSKLLRATVATPGNDYRLGANEAPPAIVSVFLGEQLSGIFEQLAGGEAKGRGPDIKDIFLGASTLPKLPKDMTDRNRTSPFAFTGNKFEFRMLGSSQSPAMANSVLNTIVAESLREMADALEKSRDVAATARELCVAIAKAHRKVIFNGNGYSAEWQREAAKRGLPNIKNCVDSILALREKENGDVLAKHGILSKAELHSRVDIMLDHYIKTLNIEARTCLHMAKRQIIPTVVAFSGQVAGVVLALKAAGAKNGVAASLLKKATALADKLDKDVAALEQKLESAGGEENLEKQAKVFRDQVLSGMNAVRESADALESIVDSSLWPLPSYAEMLFYR